MTFFPLILPLFEVILPLFGVILARVTPLVFVNYGLILALRKRFTQKKVVLPSHIKYCTSESLILYLLSHPYLTYLLYTHLYLFSQSNLTY
jgi:hypothetical protein